MHDIMPLLTKVYLWNLWSGHIWTDHYALALWCKKFRLNLFVCWNL